MKSTTLKTNHPMYAKLVAHFNKQYRNVATIQRVYINNGQVFAGDYTRTDGIVSIASGSAGADQVINFK